MAAIITDQLRILNAQNFVSGVQSSSNSYYTFIGLPNSNDYSDDWNENPPSPKDNLDQTNIIWDQMMALKKINSSDVNLVVRKISWESGRTYDMWRNDIDRDNPSNPSGSFDIYDSNFYVMNSDFRVYICLYNNALPENNFQGGPSLDEPTFTDLEPREAGSSGDGYIWKYLYTIQPSQAIKFDSSQYIPVPSDWDNDTNVAPVRNNAAVSGQIKMVTIRNRGVGLGAPNITYTGVPIRGDGNGATATVVINNDSTVESVTVSSGGRGYTFGTLDLAAGGVPTGITEASFDVIIPPPGGHGANIYTELGVFNALTYSRFENDTDNPDFITGNQFSQIGLVQNPLANNSTAILNSDKASALYAIRLTGAGYSSANFTADSQVTQAVGVNSTAVGRVVSYDSVTGVLKIWQDRTNCGFKTDGTADPDPVYGFKQNRFTGTPAAGGSIIVQGGSVNLGIDTNFSGISTVINNRTYYLGQNFNDGVAQPEAEKYSGKIIYVDNRPAITRSSSQKEDVKIILQF
jgi:hypothetical protein